VRKASPSPSSARIEGVETVLEMLLADLDLTMALCGHTEPG
jgi:isopentenyl diphosphate isomerase/L-lactate dehydrogenase-like FMN-dependent dehydrogenase